MSSNRVLEPSRNLDPQLRLRSQVAELESRLEALQRQFSNTRRVYTFSGASTLSLGSFDGDNITGIRISAAGLTVGHTTDTWMRLRPNGSSAYSCAHTVHRFYTDSTPSNGHDIILGGAITTNQIVVAATNWNTNGNYLAFEGTFFTNKLANQTRQYIGRYQNEDYVNSALQRLQGNILGFWYDASTVLSSLSLGLDAGTFSGRVSVEVLP